jgi:hypothetical protein
MGPLLTDDCLIVLRFSGLLEPATLDEFLVAIRGEFGWFVVQDIDNTA